MPDSRQAAAPSDPSLDRAAAELLWAAASELRFDATVPRKLVHRNFIDHVLVTDLRRLADGHFLCASRLPQMHGYFNEGYEKPCCSIFAVSEIARQSSLAISHRFLEIPDGYFQIMQGGWVEMVGPSADCGSTPETAELLVEVRLTNERYRRSGELIGLHATYNGYLSSTCVFRGHGEWNMVPRKLYERLRNSDSDSAATEDPGAPVEPCLVGRETPRHVVITEPANRSSSSAYHAYLIVDRQHPYFFEHDCDHVPGMLLLEGCSQFSVAIAAKRDGCRPRDLALQRYEMSFSRFAGLGAPVRFETVTDSVDGGAADRGALEGGARSFQVTASQGDQEFAEFELTVGPRRRPDLSGNLA